MSDAPSDARPTEALAQALAGTRFGDVPADVLLTGKACLLDTLCVALAGCREPLVDIVGGVVDEFGRDEGSTLIGRGRRAGAPDAALVNGAAAHALDFDDMHIASSSHPSVPVVCAALALAERGRASGRDVLRAVVLGIETTVRIGESVNPSHYQRGWHSTGTLGHFGAATAAGALLGLGAEPLTMALGIAATQASGLKQMFGTMAKPLHAGQAARDGVMAALLAERGFTSNPRALEGRAGFGVVTSDGADWSRLLEDWGREWSIRRVLYKCHASSFCTQALIEGVIGLRRRHGLAPDDVAAMRIAVSRQSIDNARIGEPATGMEGKFSLTHAAAQALVYGQATESDFTDERAREPGLAALRARTEISLGESLGWAESRVEIETRDGRVLREDVDLHERTADAQAKWTLAQNKFRSVTASRLGARRSEAVVGAVHEIDAAPNVEPLMALVAALNPF
jgi:2-methylcitrate dehydratase PrpD